VDGDLVPSYLYGRWLEVEGKLRLALGVFLMLDYDGTLTHIVSTPEEARLSPEVRRLLEGLARAGRWVKVAVISGRMVRQLQELVGVEGIYYAGLHGLVIVGPGLQFIHEDAARLRKMVREVRDVFERELQGLEGVLIEDKGLSVAVHYRQAPPGVGRRAVRIVSSVLAERSGLRALKGKKVVEVMPDVDWDKGKAAELLLAKTSSTDYLPVYVGDDETDEYAFKSLNRVGLTVVVGKRRRSYAKLYVKTVEEVHELLRRVLKLATL